MRMIMAVSLRLVYLIFDVIPELSVMEPLSGGPWRSTAVSRWRRSPRGFGVSRQAMISDVRGSCCQVALLWSTGQEAVHYRPDASS